jgi:hypothetical protein
MIIINTLLVLSFFIAPWFLLLLVLTDNNKLNKQLKDLKKGGK